VSAWTGAGLSRCPELRAIFVARPPDLVTPGTIRVGDAVPVVDGVGRASAGDVPMVLRID
jgi:hypothetical protein